MTNKTLNSGTARRFIFFAAVGGFGTLLNTGILYLLAQRLDMNYLLAAAIATEIAIVSNFIGNNYITFRADRKGSIWRKFATFQLISLVALLGTVFFLWLFVTLFGKELLLVWNAAAILIMFVVNFTLNSLFTWNAKHGEGTGEKNSEKKPVTLLIILIALALLALPMTRADNSSSSNATLTADNSTNITNTSSDPLSNATITQVDTQNSTNSTNQSDNNNSSITTPAIPQSDSNLTNSTNSTVDNSTNTSNTTQSGTDNTPLFLSQPDNSTNQTDSTPPPMRQSAINTAASTASSTSTDVVAVSQLGYHPSSIKEVVVYTHSTSGTFNIRNANTDAILASLPLQRPQDYAGTSTNCQGNMPCLVGDFTNFTTPGTYYIEESGANSPQFSISASIFSNTIPLFLEFFDAQLQQGSSYHADMHTGYSPAFTSIADGSFIMEADQAALPLIRLGSAYRRDPQIFQSDKYTILAPGKPDMQEYIVSYVNYLESLQGVSVQVGNSPGAARLASGVLVSDVFVPGPTNLTSINVYIPGNPPKKLQSAPVVSLCGASDGSARWSKCISDAALFYKCQIDEPCLNLTYNDLRGTITSNPSLNGYAVSQGWSYDFGCYFDVDLVNGNFNNGQVNPCQLFYNKTTRAYTAMTDLAFLEAWPAVNDYSAAKGQELLSRAINTFNYLQGGTFSINDNISGYFGAAAFLLYDYTNNSAYLQQAYSVRADARIDASTVFLSDATHGNEFYWEEYVRHAAAITAAGLTYNVGTKNPSEYFSDKIFNDYKDRGQLSIGENGERVFEYDPSIPFMNSRYMMTEAILAQKTTELSPAPEYFVPVVSQNQFSWLTGMNNVQQGTGLNAPTASMSFIFGIGSYPTQFHSRWLIDTGYSAASGGSIVGSRGSGYQFLDTASNTYQDFDGMTNILGFTLGAQGNNWRGEASNDPLVVGRTFNNGKSYIPGWINGAFPAQDGDTIYNYNDDLHAYEYTETTNELVATAIEYIAYLDGDLNNRTGPYLIDPPSNLTNTTNQTNATNLSSLQILTIPGRVNVTLNATLNTSTDANGNALLQNITPGTYTITATKTNYTTYIAPITLQPLLNSVNITLNPILSNSTNTTNSTNSTNATNSNATNASANIISTDTSLPLTGTVNGTGQYFMYEDGNATFHVNSDGPNNLTWYVDGVAQATTQSQNASFTWSPGILWVPRAPDYSNTATSKITASSKSGSVSWYMQVGNIINPFFSSKSDQGDVVGSADTKVHVFASNATDFTSVSVTILSSSGNAVYPLSIQHTDAVETDWSVYIPTTTYGNNYLSAITVSNNVTGTSKTYSIGTSRAHYRTSPASGSSGRVSNFGGGGGGAVAAAQPPELVYLLLSKDVVGVNQSETITLDAKDFGQGVATVEAELLSPNQTKVSIPLELVNGTNYYGTWSATFGNLVVGKYTVTAVNMTSVVGAGSTELPVTDRSFYYTGETSTLGNLSLVYLVLGDSTVENGTNVTLSLDAADADGIVAASATVQNSRSENLTVPLHLVSGNHNYGTWEGNFTPDTPDSTYSVSDVTLSNSKENKTYSVTDRSVYVLPSAKQNSGGGGLTGAATSPLSALSIANLVKEPLVPTIIGFALMVVVAGGLIVARRIGG